MNLRVVRREMLCLLELLDRVGKALQLRVGDGKLLPKNEIVGSSLCSFFKIFRSLGGLSLTESNLTEPFERIEILRIDAQGGCKFGLCGVFILFLEQRLGETAVRACIIGRLPEHGSE